MLKAAATALLLILVTGLVPAAPIPDEIVFPSSVGEVRFPHRAHVKKKCITCHHQIHAGALDTPHEAYLDSSSVHCRTCHDSSPELSGKYYKCSECHHSVPANIADETLSAKVVIHQRCWQCQEAGSGVAASASCDGCHVKDTAATAALPGNRAGDPGPKTN
jgi:hypothetical protein